MDEGDYCIFWNNYHESLVNNLCGLQRQGDMADITVVCGDGSRVRAHQLILASCSSFFRDFLQENPSKHPIVLLPMEIHYPELKAMVEFMYTGQVSLSQDRLQSFMRGARYLHIRGVEDASESFQQECVSDLNNAKGDPSETGNSAQPTNKGVTTPAITTTTTTIDAGSLLPKGHEYSKWAECLQCHTRMMLPYEESTSMKHLCSKCSTPGTSKSQENDQHRKKKGKRKISDKTEQNALGKKQEEGWNKKIKLEPQDRSIELETIEDRIEEEEVHKIIYCTAQDTLEQPVDTTVDHLKSPSATKVKKLKCYSSPRVKKPKDFYGAIEVKKEQPGSNTTLFKVLGLFGVTGRKKRYSVTEAEVLRRQGAPEHFSNNAMKTYLRFPRTQDALPERFRTPSQRKTTISTFTNIIEGEAADLAQDFQRFLFSSDLMEYLFQGVDSKNNISEVLDRMLDNLSQVSWTSEFNLLTHGAGLMFVRAVLLYVRTLAQ